MPGDRAIGEGTAAVWGDLSMRHLLALRAVADEGTFGRAAQRLGFTQSAVSQQVAALEQIVGHTLFDRPSGPRRPVLTPTGELVLDHARRVLDHVDRAEREVELFARGVTGRLRIGTFQSASARLIPAILQQLQEVTPGVDVTLVEDDPEGDFRRGALQRGELDIGFVNGEPGDGFDGRFIVADPYVAIVPAGEPPGPIRLAELDGRAMVAMPVDDVCGRPIERAIEDLGVRPRYVFRTHDNGAVQAMVREGIGITVQPHLTVNETDPLIEVRPIEPVLPPRQITVIWPTNRSLSPVAQVAVDVAVEVGARLAATMQAVVPV